MIEIATSVRMQANIFALQAVMAAMIIQMIEGHADPEARGRDLLDTALGSIAKFDLRGENPPEAIETVRAMMEATATDTVSAALHSVRLRKQAGR